ncbi:23S ribosomal RNA methyltransferase Erm [Candidatus Collierbacteria bacterium]|nr:23S ribosomal RNA methyltransferase Erm [Candidatus Collierbacteria bacterium]
MFKLRREQLSQVFLHSPELVKRLIGKSSIGKNDTVIEIGPGKGIITKILLQSAKTVIAIERDPTLYSQLKQQFCSYSNLDLICADFLSFKLPNEPYKVFANIPFSIEGKIIRKLIDAPNPPEDCYLVMREELAKRLAGIFNNGLFAITHKPWFDFEIFHRFQRIDFIPKPQVESAMLRFYKRTNPLLPESEKPRFQKFVTNIFGGGRRMRQNLRQEFNPDQINNLSQQLKINLNSKSKRLSPDQWISLYRYKYLSLRGAPTIGSRTT